MSRYSTSRVRLTSMALRQRGRLGGLVAQTESVYGGLTDIPTAQSLRGCTSALTGGNLLGARDQLAALASVAETIDASRGSRAVLAVASSERLVRSESFLEEARRALERNDEASALSALAEGRRDLLQAVETAADQLGTEDVRLSADLLTESLRELGYTVNVHHGQGSTGVWAERPGRTIAALVAEDSMELDTAGCDDLACLPEMQRVSDALSRRGLETKLIRQTVHRDDRGGSLIQKAGATQAARHDHDYARGIVEQLDASAPSPAPASRRIALSVRQRT